MIDPEKSDAQKRADEYNAGSRASRSVNVESKRVETAYGGPAMFQKQVRREMRDARHDGHPISRDDAKSILAQKLYRAEEKARSEDKPPSPKDQEKEPQISKVPENKPFNTRQSNPPDPVDRSGSARESSFSAPELGPVPDQRPKLPAGGKWQDFEICGGTIVTVWVRA